LIRTGEHRGRHEQRSEQKVGAETYASNFE